MVPSNFDALLGNFSQMSVTYQIALNGTSAGGNFSGSASYSVIGRPEINSTLLYKVLINSSSIGVAQGMTVWFTPGGNAVIAELNGENLTGTSAQGPVNLAMIPFYLELYTVQRLKEFTNNAFVTVLNQTSTQLGPTKVQVTYYKPKSAPFTETYCGVSVTVREMLLGSGVVPGSSFVVATYFAGEVSVNSALSGYLIRVTSLKT
jgi:hypothetical protein